MYFLFNVVNIWQFKTLCKKQSVQTSPGFDFCTMEIVFNHTGFWYVYIVSLVMYLFKWLTSKQLFEGIRNLLCGMLNYAFILYFVL